MKSWTNLEPDQYKLLTTRFSPGRAGNSIRFIVVHHNGGTLSGQQIHDLWTYQREASAHYQVDVYGLITQLVNDSDTAWHAGDWDTNLVSIGVEHANSYGTSGPLTASTLDNGAHLVAALCLGYGLGRPAWKVNVYPHYYFFSTACPGPIANVQFAAYMATAQAHYDRMTGMSPASVNVSTTEGTPVTVPTTTTTARVPLSWDETKQAAREGAATVSYGDTIPTWGAGYPTIYNAAKTGVPEIRAGVATLLAEVARANAAIAAQSVAIDALSQAISALATDAQTDNAKLDTLVQDITAAVTAAGEQAAQLAQDVLRDALDGATVTLDTAPDAVPAPEGIVSTPAPPPAVQGTGPARGADPR